MRRVSFLPPSNRVLLVTSLILNIILFLSVYPNRTGVVNAGAGNGRGGVGTLAERGGDGCTMCGSAPELCDEIGETKMQQAISYGGSNDRLRRLLAKIKVGEPFTVGVIGGSVSQGNAILWGPDSEVPREPWYRPPGMHRIIFEHLHSLSPLSANDPIPFDMKATTTVGSASGTKAVFGRSGKREGKNALINGAQGGTGSGYFAYCWGEHMDQDVDLFIIELAINDELLIRNVESYELLIRSLLDLPQKPAVLNVEVFALLFKTIAFGGEMHKGINEFYDIPSVSLRNPFLPQVVGNFKEVEKFFNRNSGQKGQAEGMDLRHISHYGHRLTGELVNAYIDMQLCEMERRRPFRPEARDRKRIEERYPVADIPKMRLNKQYRPSNIVQPLKPQCFTMKSDRHKLEPLKQKGWRIWSHGEKHYWISTDIGSTISFSFSTALGEVQLHYLRSKIFGLGNVWCWVDDAKDAGIRIEGYWDQDFNIAQSKSISGIKPGDHVLHCENEIHTADPGGGHEFRIISLTSI